MPNNYVLIERIELNNTAASVTFDNIPQSGYTDLKLVVSARGDASSSSVDLRLRFNSNTTSTYSHRRIQGNGATAVSAQELNGTSVYCGEISAATGTSSTFSNTEIYVPNYLSTTAKSFSVDAAQENNTTTAYASLFASIWNPSTQAPINAVNFILGTGNFVTGSTFSLYGMAQVGTTPTRAPKADGGNVIGTDGTYWYHAFLSNGTFTPQVGLSCDYLVIGGGGGAANAGGGGGAGGFRSATSVPLAIGNFAVTVGAGGAGGVANGGPGETNGIDSTFNSFTATGGGKSAGYGSNAIGTAGGSGGGGGQFNVSTTLTGGAGNTPSTSPSQGNNGGTGSFSGTNTARATGGGGGATAVGGNASGGTGGNGGAGSNSFSSWATATGTGVSGFYAGGGAGFGGGGSPASGGSGGGGAGGYTVNDQNQQQGTSGTPNTGGGGGGSGFYRASGNGGSGIVIIRYLVA